MDREITMSVEGQLELLEKEVDSFFSSLAIRHYPLNLARWAVLTKTGIELQRAAEPEYGGAKHRTVVINLSRIAALLLSEIAAKGNRRYASQKSLRWSAELDLATYRALTETEGYFDAWANFAPKALPRRSARSLSKVHERRVPAGTPG
jgi:hypothetical protein